MQDKLVQKKYVQHAPWADKVARYTPVWHADERIIQQNSMGV